MDCFRFIVEIAGGITVVGALVVPLYRTVKKQMDKVDLVQDALVGLLHDRICELCETYIKKGYATNDERQQLEILYKPYKAMGGNHNAASLYDQVLDHLPLTKNN